MSMATKRKRKPTPLDLGEWITAREGVAMTGYNEAYIRHLAHEGYVESRKVASALLLSRASLLAYKTGMDALGTKRFSKTRSKRYPSKTKGDATVRAVKEASSNVPYEAKLQVRSIFDLPFISKKELRARNEAARALLNELASATDEEAEDQRETGKLLIKALAGPRLQFHTFPELGDEAEEESEGEANAIPFIGAAPKR
jgi:hypothetical protein